MRSHKKTPFLIVLVAIFVLVSVSSCGRSGQNSDPESIEKWILATSVSIMEEFSPETFIQLKDAGIDYAELGLRAPQFYADSSVREEFCRQVKEAAEAKTYGVELVIECLPRTCLGNSSEEILWLLEGNENLGVCCDVNHLLKETPEEFIQKVGQRITTLHISDYDGLDERHWAPGEGIIDWNLVIASLLAADYSGPFLFEYNDTPEKKMMVWQKLKRDFLRSTSKSFF